MHFELSAKQHKALFSTADITICGGGNGGGKSHTLRVLPILPEYLTAPGCRTVIFAESNPKLEQADGMVDECKKLYGAIHPKGLGGYRQSPKKRWTWPSQATVDLSFVGVPGQWDGLQAAIVGIDQVEQITAQQFESVAGRNRTMADVRPRIIATANPPAEGKDHWLTQLLGAGGWIDEDGWAIEAMDGVVRFYVRTGNDYLFADNPDELLPHCKRGSDGQPVRPRSMTFVQMLVKDHPDPEFRRQYEVALADMGEVEQLRRWDGNWHATEEAGKYFRKDMFPLVEYKPTHEADLVRSWDNAWSTSESADWTPGALTAREPDGFKTIIDLIRFRGTFRHLEWAVKKVAARDRELFGGRVVIRLPKDAGAAGGLQSELARWLGDHGYIVQLSQDKGDKLTRSKPYQSCCGRMEYRLAKSHYTADISKELLLPFHACQSDGTIIKVPGLDKSNVSTLAGWHPRFLTDHILFGRNTVKKRSVKKDTVDAMVGAHELLTSEQGRDPAGDDLEAIENATTQAQREVGGYRNVGFNEGSVGSQPMGFGGGRSRGSGWL
jgi:phage terminase large subunit-like protein